MGYGNLAYEDDYYIAEKSLHKKQNAPIKKRKANKIRYMRYIAAICIMAVSAGFMISTFVSVHETKATVASLESKLADEEAITGQKAFDLDHSIDLATIEEEATTRLGMKRPEKYQTIYVNVEREDVTEKTVGEVENTVGKLGAWFKKISGNIVEFFSIK